MVRYVSTFKMVRAMSSSQRMITEIDKQPKLLRIGEAARVLGLEPYVLRYWESEFPHLSPLRTRKGQRLFTQGDMDILRRIQKLLHEEGLTIDGARRRLDEGARVRELTQAIAEELHGIRDIIAGSLREKNR